jgi:hypothetical protein
MDWIPNFPQINIVHRSSTAVCSTIVAPVIPINLAHLFSSIVGNVERARRVAADLGMGFNWMTLDYRSLEFIKIDNHM